MMNPFPDTAITADMDHLTITSRRTYSGNPHTLPSSVDDPLSTDLGHGGAPILHSRNPQLQHSITEPTDKNDHGLGISTAPSAIPRDAWEGQGDFPLRLEKVSHSVVPVLGGVQLIFTGANFRGGVQAVFECPQLGGAVQPKIVTPNVLRDTQMVANAPNLLDWWALLHKDSSHSRGSMTVSVTLVCAGISNSEDQGTVFSLVATEESETDLLHVIIALHRKLILTLLDYEDPEAEKVARQRTRTLLDLKQPSAVTKSEHLALGVIYMLCDDYNHITGDTIDTLLCTSEQGRDVLHFATVLGLSTLVREIARHALERFRSRPITEESKVFAKDALGNTALDLAKILGHDEIQHALQETLDAAEEFKKSAIQAPLRPLPDPPVPDRPHRPGSISNSSSSNIFAGNGVSAQPHTLNRPLPPTPMTSPPQPDMPSTVVSASPPHSHHSATTTPYLPPQGLPISHTIAPPSEPVPHLYTPPGSTQIGHSLYTSSAPCATPATVSPAMFDTSLYPGSMPSASAHQPPYVPAQSIHYPTPAPYTSAPAPAPYNSAPAPYTSTPAQHPYHPTASYPYPQQHYPFPQQQAPPSPTSMPFPMAQPPPPPVSMPTPLLPSTPLNTSPVPGFMNPYAVLDQQPMPPYRANTSPLLHSGGSTQGQSSPQLPYQAAIAPFRPLPLTPGGSAPSLPLPPPKHKVTQVNRPKQFTIPSATNPHQSEQPGLNPAQSPALQSYNPYAQSQDPRIKVQVP